MATIISKADCNLSDANAFYRVEADNLCANSTTSLPLTTGRYINTTFANAGNCQGIGLWLYATTMTSREAVAILEQIQPVDSFNTTTDKVNRTSHGLNDLDLVTFTTTGALPGNVSLVTQYYVRNKTTNDFQLSTTPTGAIVNISGTPTGTATVGVQRAISTKTPDDICGTFQSGPFKYRGDYITNFIFSTPYAVDTTASKWRFFIKHGNGVGSWGVFTSDATALFYYTWCDTSVSFINNDQLIVKDYVTIDQSCTFNGKLGTGDAVTGTSIIICSNVVDATIDNVSYLKWDDTPAASYTMAIGGKIMFARFSGFRVGTSTNRIPYAQQAIISFTAPTVGTAKPGFFSASTGSSTYVYGGSSLFLYGSIPTYEKTTLTSNALAGQKNLVCADAVDWVHNDMVVVGKQNVQGQGDITIHTVDSVAGNTITLNENLATNTRLTDATVLRLNGYGVKIRDTSTYSNGSFVNPLNFVMSGFEASNISLVSNTNATYAPYNLASPASYGSQFLMEDGISYVTNNSIYYLFNTLSLPNNGFLVQRVNTFRQIPIYAISSVFYAGYNSGRITIKDSSILSLYSGGIGYIGTTNNKVSLYNCSFENVRNSAQALWFQGIACEYYDNTFWGSAIATAGTVTVGQLINPIKIQNNKYNNCALAMGFATATGVNCVDESSIFGDEVVNTIDIAWAAGSFPDYIFKNVSAPAGGLVIDETYVADMVLGGRVGFVNYDNVATDDRMIFTYGKTQRCNATLTDTTTLQGDTNSFRFCPTSSTDLFEYTIDVPTGNIQNKDMVIGIWLKIKSANYWAGTSYAMPRMTISYDDGTTVYAEAAKTTDEQYLHVPFTPTTTTGKVTMTRSGYTDATGTDVCFYWGRSPIFYPVGYILNNSNLDNWDLGLPVNPPISTLFSASDIWAVDASDAGAGTTKAELNKAAKALSLGQFIALK